MTIKRPLQLLLPLLLTFGLLGLVQAKEIKYMSADEVETFVNIYTEGDYEDEKDGDFSFEMKGVKVLLLTSGKNMQLYAGFVHDSSYKEMNQWNADKRFSRAYLDSDDDPVVESDLDLEGGVTLGAVREFFDTFAITVEAFKKHINY